MATRDAFAGKFNKLLKEIPRDYTLAQWQFLYQQAILSMGTRILERFQQDAIGPDPFDTGPPPPPPPPPVLPLPAPPPGGTIVVINTGGGPGQGGHLCLPVAALALSVQVKVATKNPQ
ncbi:MAG: hypothetical protein ACLPV8_03630 [Steroidobacteraceae bacterium]